MNNNNAYSVADIVSYLSKKNDADPLLMNIMVSGELSNVKIYPSKHMYFDLKDENAKLSGVMFAQATPNLNFVPTSGDKVIVKGSIKVYKRNGSFQIIALSITKAGLGELYLQFEKNKKELEANGYFDQQYKQLIPKFPNKVAIISGHNSAALKDVLTTINSRYKLSQLVVFPTLVQGNEAPNKVSNIIKLINEYEFDVILLVRGGGSFEDLSAFNDLELAKTIFNSKIPVVTGIGHEVDFTIADFVSDYRAATPTAAAVLISPPVTDLLKQFEKYQSLLDSTVNNKLNYQKQLLDENFNSIMNLYQNRLTKIKTSLDRYRLNMEKNNIKYKLHIFSQSNYEGFLKLNNLFNYQLEKKKQILAIRFDYLNNLFLEQNRNKKNRLNESIIKLNLLDPNSLLDKGYTLVYHNDKVVNDLSRLKLNDDVEILSNKYNLSAKVNKVIKREK